jgi:glycosyltransferase involved in cell wall biosynthesis
VNASTGSHAERNGVKICILAAGAGGMYCGSCMRDNALAGALKRAGHDVTLVPLYTPLRTDAPSQSDSHVFFGGINIYLQHASRLFRWTPRFLDWVWDRRWLLNAATKYGASKPYAELGGLTLDLIQGEQGAAVKEVRRLASFLRDDVKPDVVSLPNLMFIGVARVFREELGLPVVCELTGEDIFLDELREPYASQVRAAIRERVPHVSRFVATCEYYAGRMAEYLGVPRERIGVVYPGLPKEFFEALPAEPNRQRDGRARTVGYLARICPEKGFERIVDAMIALREMPGMGDVQLRSGGWLGKRDRRFFESMQWRIDGSPLRGGFTYVGELDQAAKVNLLGSIDVFSAPSVYPESKGIYVLEALAAGVPAVQPAHGSFPELIGKTNGGMLTPPGDARAHAAALAELLADDQRRARHGDEARRIVREQFTDTRMAEQMLHIYEDARA